MKRLFFVLAVISLLAVSCTEQTVEMDRTGNPFFTEFTTPFGVPPFDKIKTGHFLPALREGMARQLAEIKTIIDNPEPPSFKNTIEALERSGSLVKTAGTVFDVLNEVITDDRMQKIAKTSAPLRASHSDDIFLDAKLFDRVKQVYDGRTGLKLDPEQNRLLEKIYLDFVRSGAGLDKARKNRLRKINEELSLLSVRFGENVLAENNRFEMVIDNEEDLAGLPPNVRRAAAETAGEKGKTGKWVFTLHKPSLIPFLQYSEKRDLREKMFKGYINRGDHNDVLDNKKILSRIAALRVEHAHLLGYKTHADYVLEENMAKTPAHVYDLLERLWKPALKRAKAEARDMQTMIDDQGLGFELQPWDWWFFSEKVKKAQYDLDDEALRPYFKLEQVKEGAFWTAGRLFGIRFVQRSDVPVYHPDVVAYEVLDKDSSFLGILYTDYFPRTSKGGGAWMNDFREQYRIGENDIRPVVTNNGNFTKPLADQPSLLSPEEVATLFHEFGHGLHSLLSRCTYKKLSGTNVTRDFVELPSQIMENWAFEPEVLAVYAKHYQTGETIPRTLVDKMKKAGFFNKGFETVEFVAAAFLDMDWHTLTDSVERDPNAFEMASMERIGLIPEIVTRYRSPYFSHIFDGGYSAGYYNYIWADVLVADAFDLFREKGIFDPQTALSFRKKILETGGIEDPVVQYRRFRGSDPKVEPLLRQEGLLGP